MLLFAFLLSTFFLKNVLSQTFCGNVNEEGCWEQDFSQLNTSETKDLVDSNNLKQFDDPLADKSFPGNWNVNSNNRLIEDSDIRSENEGKCPPTRDAYGSVLAFTKALTVGGAERELRVVGKTREEFGWFGAVVAFASFDYHYRVLVGPGVSCFSIQRRQMSDEYVEIATTPFDAEVDTNYELRIRWGNNRISAKLLDIDLNTKISLSANVGILDAQSLGGHVGVFSSNNGPAGAVFRALQVYDVSRAGLINDYATRPPTPAPTPAPPPPGKEPIDCQVSNWSSWSACTQSCAMSSQPGTQTRSRVVVVSKANGGADCPVLRQTQNCNAAVPCPEQCNCVSCDRTTLITGSSAWCRCCTFAENPSCSQVARCNAPSSVFKKQGCIDAGWCKLNATGQARYCGFADFPDQGFCKGIEPVPCKVSAWGDWGACSLSCATDGGTIPPNSIPDGQQVRSRVVVQNPDSGGATCPPLSESRYCNTKLCPQDCVMSEWSEWTDCSQPCGTPGGQQSRNRTIITQPNFTGEKCLATSEIQNCNTEESCNTDCTTSFWSQWSVCNATPQDCMNGKRTRTREVIVPQTGSGDPCPALSEDETCTDNCPVDCVLEEWSEWSTCNKACGGGVQSRSRDVVTPAANTGAPCGDLEEEQVCNSQTCAPDVVNTDCQVSEWSAEPCSRYCGGGTTTRRRTVVTPSSGNGADCPVLMEQIECNTQECRTLLSSYVLYRVTSSNEITSFVWLQFRDEVAATLELNANRVQFVAVKAGSTIVEYKLYDAEDDPAANYATKSQDLASSGAPLNIQQVENLGSFDDNVVPPTDPPETTSARVTTTTSDVVITTSTALGETPGTQGTTTLATTTPTGDGTTSTSSDGATPGVTTSTTTNDAPGTPVGTPAPGGTTADRTTMSQGQETISVSETEPALVEDEETLLGMAQGAGIAVICVIVCLVLAIIGALIYVFAIRGKGDKGAKSSAYDMGGVNELSMKNTAVVADSDSDEAAETFIAKHFEESEGDSSDTPPIDVEKKPSKKSSRRRKQKTPSPTETEESSEEVTSSAMETESSS